MRGTRVLQSFDRQKHQLGLSRDGAEERSGGSDGEEEAKRFYRVYSDERDFGGVFALGRFNREGKSGLCSVKRRHSPGNLLLSVGGRRREKAAS